MEETPFQNTPIQRLKVAILPLDLPCSGIVTHSHEILPNGTTNKKKPDGFFLKTRHGNKKCLLIKTFVVLRAVLLQRTCSSTWCSHLNTITTWRSSATFGIIPRTNNWISKVFMSSHKFRHFVRPSSVLHKCCTMSKTLFLCLPQITL